MSRVGDDASGENEPNTVFDASNEISATNEQTSTSILHDNSILLESAPFVPVATDDIAASAGYIDPLLLLPRPTEPIRLDTVNNVEHTPHRTVGRPIHSLYLPGPDGALIDCKNTLYSHSLAEFNEAIVDGSTSLFCNEHDFNANDANGLVAVMADSDCSTESRPWDDHGHRRILVDDVNNVHANGDNAPNNNVATGFYKQVMHGIRRISTSLLSSSTAIGAASHSRPSAADSSPTLVLELQSLSTNRQPDSLQPPVADVDDLIYHPTGRPIVSNDPNVELTASSDEGSRLLATNATADNTRLEPWWQPRWLLLRLCALVIVALVVVLLLLVSGRLQAPNRLSFGTNHPSSPEISNRRAQQIMDFINNITLSGQHIALVEIHAGFGATPATAEERAMRWLIHDDQLRLASSQKFRLQQRYALATLWTLQSKDAPTSDKIIRHECEWTGISCVKSDIGLVVTNISLFNASWSGSLVAEVGLLSSLVHFDMSNNSLTGTLPSSIDRWTKLSHFDVSNNSLAGALPTSIGRWTNLTRFDVSFNQLIRSLPEEIGSWTKLNYFEVSNNSLTGALPQSTEQWTRLKHFGVYNNSWTGELPDFMGQWTNMNYFNAWGEIHNGSVLEQLQYLPDIVRYISSIATGNFTIQRLPSLAPSADFVQISAEETAIQWLLENSLLTNFAPDTPFRQFKLQQRYALATLWAQTPLRNVMVDECDWAGVSCELADMEKGIGTVAAVSKIDFAQLDHWNWHWDRKCQASADLGMLNRLVHFDLGTIPLTGSLPDSFAAWTDLEYFSASGTSIAGSLPESIGNWSALTHFDVKGNKLKGSLPVAIGQWTNLEWFSVSMNKLTGELPTSVGNWKNLVTFYGMENRFSGTLPKSIGQWTQLETFFIYRNRIQGTLPESIGNWTQLQMARMFSNRMEGSIPLRVCSANNLTEFWVGCGEINCTCGRPKCVCTINGRG